MTLISNLKFRISFLLDSIPIMFRILCLFFFNILYKLLGNDPGAVRTFFSLSSLPSPKGRRRAYPSLYLKELHEYRAPGPNDYRSPCPALNAMANHGYIPRDGKNLTGTNLTHGLMACYNLSWPLAAFLSWGGVLLLGQVGHLSLHDLARHNRIEHDASLTHRNTPPGEEYAPFHSCRKLFKAFLRYSLNDKIGVEELARARIHREREPGVEVNVVQQEIARGEVALVIQIFGGKEFAVPIDILESWWRDERLPEGWEPTRQTTLSDTINWASKIRERMQELRDAEDVTVEVDHEDDEKLPGLLLDGEIEQMHRFRNDNSDLLRTPQSANGRFDSNPSSATSSPSPRTPSSIAPDLLPHIGKEHMLPLSQVAVAH